MERLGHLIQNAIDNGSSKPTRVSGGLGVVYLFFDDHLFLFGRAKDLQASCMKEIFDNFCQALGAKMNF